MIYVISKPIVFTLVGKSPPFVCFYCPHSMPRCPHSPLPALHCPSSLGWLPWVALCQLILPFVERPKAVAGSSFTKLPRILRISRMSPSQVRAYKGAGRETRPGAEQKVSLLLNFSVYFSFFHFSPG